MAKTRHGLMYSNVLVFNSLNMVINVTTKLHIKTVYFAISDDISES